jgi:hypothetical protein
MKPLCTTNFLKRVKKKKKEGGGGEKSKNSALRAPRLRVQERTNKQLMRNS